jgi:hypothetical protein
LRSSALLPLLLLLVFRGYSKAKEHGVIGHRIMAPKAKIAGYMSLMMAFQNCFAWA